MGTAIGQALPQLGKTWFFITADYVFGRALQEGATAVIEKNGGKVVGSVRHPLGTTDFSSFMLQAQASKADVVAIANGGDDADQRGQDRARIRHHGQAESRAVRLRLAAGDQAPPACNSRRA